MPSFQLTMAVRAELSSFTDHILIFSRSTRATTRLRHLVRRVSMQVVEAAAGGESSTANQETRQKVAVRRRSDWMLQEVKEVGLGQSLDVGGLR
jgi:hypothetical protein